MAVEWLGRELVRGPYICLCLNEGQFRSAMEHLEIPTTLQPHKWLTSDACVWEFTSEDSEVINSMTCVVCLDEKKSEGKDPIVVAGLLVHEAVHVFQKWCADVGEKIPSDEFQAYSVQNIAQKLMWAYSDHVSKRRA